MAEPVDDSQINPIFLEQLQNALESDREEEQVEDLNLGVDDQLLVDSLRSIIAGDNNDAQQPQNWNQMDANADIGTLEAVQNALKELGGTEVAPAGWKRSLTEEDRDRIRNDNRTRKRKWRDTHVMRNKDNDLRSRIVRRATIMFGEHNTPQKQMWIEEEFQNRRERRFMKDSNPWFRQSSEDYNQNRLHQLFRQSNSALDSIPLGSAASKFLHATLNSPRPPPFTTKYVTKPRSFIPPRIVSQDARTLGAPPKLTKFVKQVEPERKSEKVLGKTGEKLGLTPLPKRWFEKFGLPNLPDNLSKMGPMPPLPKSIIEHQKREKEQKEREEKSKQLEQGKDQQEEEAADTVAQRTVAAPPAEGSQQADEQAQQAQKAQQAQPDYRDRQAQPPVIPETGANDGSQQLSDDDLGNLDDMLGNALSALNGDDNDDIGDPSNAIQELQAALAQQGLFQQ